MLAECVTSGLTIPEQASRRLANEAARMACSTWCNSFNLVQLSFNSRANHPSVLKTCSRALTVCTRYKGAREDLRLMTLTSAFDRRYLAVRPFPHICGFLLR